MEEKLTGVVVTFEDRLALTSFVAAHCGAIGLDDLAFEFVLARHPD